MPNTHRTLTCVAGAALFAAFVLTGPVWAQSAGQAPSTQARPTQPAVPPAQPQSLQGDLVRVDLEAKTLTVAPSQGVEQTFKYTDDTKVIGAEKGVAGLATMKGSHVTVQFKVDGKDRVATQIEIHPRR
jgi:hypothetical protein